MTVTINVKQEHIDAGDRAMCLSCPVARAIADAGFSGATAGVIWLAGNKGETHYRAEVPDEVHAFMAEFDRSGHGSVSPFTFVADFMPCNY